LVKKKQIKPEKTMIRSTKVSLKYANTGKSEELSGFREEYRKAVAFYIDILWEMDEIPRLLPWEVTSSLNTWLSARACQAAAKQAGGIVRGTRKKHMQRLHVHQKLLDAKLFKKARRLQKIIDKNPISKPVPEHVNPELDSRFVSFDLSNETSFDGWMTISSIGNGLKIKIPFKKTKHFNSLEHMKMKTGVRLGSRTATIMFESDVPDADGDVVGVDIGMKSALTVSDGQSDIVDPHGHTLESIQARLSRKQKGSKSFKRTQRHRTNHINRMINSVDLDGVGVVRIEKIKDLRRGRRSSRSMSHWTYTEIFDKIQSTCEERGVRVERVDPAYTSQRCSKCGWTRKRNRRGKEFRCGACGYACDADLNASVNISLGLPAIGGKRRRGRPNLKGFYWAPEVGSL